MVGMPPSIILIGVGHVFAIRDRVKEEILRARPSVVCLELDRMRWDELLRERERRLRKEKGERGHFDWRTIGRGGIIFGLIAWKQGSLAKSFGSTVGDEMLAAKEAADEVGAQTRLIDMDTGVFVRRWMGKLSRRERAKLFLSAIGAIFASRKRVEKELKEFFEDEDSFVQELARAFPQTKTALIDERNIYMARGIEGAVGAGPVVVAVVGAGHIAGIREELLRGGRSPDAIRVVNLQALQAPASNAEFSVTFPPPPGGGSP